MSHTISITHWLLFCAVLIAMSLLTFRELSLQPDGGLHVYFLDIGQGDSTLLVTPSGKQVLIDGGPNLSALEHLGNFLPFLDRTIDLLVLTHPDADHVTALPEVLRRYKIEHVMLAGVEHSSGIYESFLAAINDLNVSVLLPDPTKDVDLGDGVVLDIVWPLPEVFGTRPKNQNDMSVVLRVLYGEESLLLTGDAEKNAEVAMLASGVDIRAKVLKVGHHGSRTSSSTGFILAVNPELAIVSAGRENKFGHPHPEIMERYRQMGIPVRNTATEGVISIVMD